jgi:sugar lactone lactonase YvrE
MRRNVVQAAVAVICIVFAFVTFLSIRFIRDVARDRKQSVPIVAIWANTGNKAGEVRGAGGLIVTAGAAFVAERANARVQKFSLSGEPLATWTHGAEDDSPLQEPADVAADPQGRIYILDAATGMIHLFDLSGSPVRAFRGAAFGAYRPQGIAVNDRGEIFLADSGNSRIVKIDSSGRPQGSWGRKGNAPDELSEPVGLRTDAAGFLYVADRGNGRVKKIDPDGHTLRIWSVPGAPERIAIDAQGHVYVSDSDQGKIWKLSPASDVRERLISRKPEDFANVTGLAATDGRLLIAGAKGLFVCASSP